MTTQNLFKNTIGAIVLATCCSADVDGQAFSYTGAVQTYIVPSGVTSLNIDMAGARGGGMTSSGDTSGFGGRVQCTLAVTAGTTLYLYVGGKGVAGGPSGVVRAGGWNGGGSGYYFGGGGGGGTDVRTGGTALSNRIIVGSGGGGATNSTTFKKSGGDGGGLTGAMSPSTSTCSGGSGGTQTAGGMGATCYMAGTGGLGTGGNSSTSYSGAPGGGGGYYGGGAGAYGGGAGGSSYPASSGGVISSVVHTSGYNSSDGYITITAICPLPSVSAISGLMSVCAGSSITLSDATPGGIWSSSSATVAVGSATGVVAGVSSGAAIVSYSVTNACGTASATTTLSVGALPTVSASTYGICGATDTLSASGATTYSWSPATGLSCATCAMTSVLPAATTTYTVTGTSSAGCTNSATVTVNGNRIYGHITFSSFAPDTLDMKVWLIQYDPTDSSITALDSMTTCYMDSVAYYEFTGKPAGNYLVKAKEVYSNPVGTSGYIPTYGVSSANWSSATGVSHGTGSDSLHITMIYGTVPAGPGFIGGNVYSGAGKKTTDVPFADMLILLKDATGNIITYTFTDGTGAYSFSGLAYGTYIIYPEEYKYNTTPATVAISSSTPTASSINFKRYVDPTFQVRPLASSLAVDAAATAHFTIYPNPASNILTLSWTDQPTRKCDVRITDVLGKEVLHTIFDVKSAKGEQVIDVSELGNGVYLISTNTENSTQNNRLVIQR